MAHRRSVAMVRSNLFLPTAVAACSLAVLAAALWPAASSEQVPPPVPVERCRSEPRGPGLASIQRCDVAVATPRAHREARTAPPPRVSVTGASAGVGESTSTAGGALAGSVVDGNGAPIAGARVRLVPWSGPLLRVPADELEALVPVGGTGADGAFAWPALPPGAYAVEVVAAGYERRVSERAGVAVGERTGLAPLVLGPAACLHGRVFTPAGAPVDGACVEVRCAAGSGVARAVTAAHGGFTVDHLAAGPFVLQVTARGFAPLRLRDVTAGRNLVLQLGDGARVRGVVRGVVRGAFDAAADLRVQLRRIDDPPQSPVARERHHLRDQIGSRLAVHGGALASPQTLRELAALERQRRQLETAHRPFGPAPSQSTAVAAGGAFAFDGLDDGVVVIEVVARCSVVARSAPVLVSAVADAFVDVVLP